MKVDWVQSRNRNRVLIFKNKSYGRIEWWETGRVLVRILKPQNMGRVKRFLCMAFYESCLIFDDRVLHDFLRHVSWKGSHDVYEMASRVPHKVIDKYRDSLGFVFRAGDSSHPKGYEIGWCKPDCLERLELLTQQIIKILEAFSGLVEPSRVERVPSYVR